MARMDQEPKASGFRFGLEGFGFRLGGLGLRLAGLGRGVEGFKIIWVWGHI